VQAIKDALWAFATMGHIPTQAFLDECAAHCLHQLSGFNPQNVANVAWAYAKFGYAPENLFTAMAEDVGSCRPSHYHPPFLGCLRIPSWPAEQATCDGWGCSITLLGMQYHSVGEPGVGNHWGGFLGNFRKAIQVAFERVGKEIS